MNYNQEDTPFLDKVERAFIKLERLINAVFYGINALINNTEYSFLNLVTVILPWLVFLAPASMTWENTGEHLGFTWERWVVAIVIEGLGLVSGSQLINDIWHNRKRENRAKEKRVNPLISGVASVFYLITTIVLNAILDVYGTQAWAQLTARVMITSLGAVAIAIIAVRGLRNEMRFDSSETRQIHDRNDSSDNYVSYDYRTELGSLPTEQLMELAQLADSRLRNWIINNYPGIDPNRARIWVGYVRRDLGQED